MTDQRPAPGLAARAPSRLAGTALAVTALVLTAGCALPPPDLKAPEISISDLTLDSLGFETTRFEVMIDARNPNADDITLTDVALRLTFLDVRIGNASLPTDRVLLAGERTTRIPVVFSMPTGRLLDLGVRLRDGALFAPSYKLEGSARWGDSFYRFPIVKEGRMDLRDSLGRLLGR